MTTSKDQLNHSTSNTDLDELKAQIKLWGKELGFDDVGFTNVDLSDYEAHYFNWIDEQFHGDMDYMERHGTKRTRPNELEPDTLSIISVRMNYFDAESHNPIKQLHSSEKAYISRYALNKDYHKIIRKRLQKLAEKIQTLVPNFQYRAFTDSAPVLERPLAEKSGLGFIGKNSLVIHPRAGSWFFLGELFCNLAFKEDPAFEKQGCGPCVACIKECPTQAILENTVVDARRCISYLTIEYKGIIPVELRDKIGNRIYGCDDCQLVCPWNKFTDDTSEQGFKNQHILDSASLLDLWNWDEKTFLTQLQGSPIRRIGFTQWKRNLAVSIGNLDQPKPSLEIHLNALNEQAGKHGELVDEHIYWAQSALTEKINRLTPSASNSKAKEPKQQLKPFVALKYYLPKTYK